MAKYTKPESERIVRRLCHDWLVEQPEAKRDHPSFTAFRTWLEGRYPGVFSFRSHAGPLYDAEMWFDRELGQSWRN
jgi:hypothetical protein